jgi:hypothetical protein
MNAEAIQLAGGVGGSGGSPAFRTKIELLVHRAFPAAFNGFNLETAVACQRWPQV